MFSTDFAAAAAPRAPVATSSESDEALTRMMRNVETIADAIQFEEALSRVNMEKREAIFKRVLDHLGPMPDDVQLPGLSADITEAIEGFESRRELARLKAEAIARERCEQEELGDDD